MKRHALNLAIGIVTSAVSGIVSAEDHTAEEVFVHGRHVSIITSEIKPSERTVVDTASVLKELPGANVNANGAVTGIAQYRGLFGDRISVNIDGAPVLSGGPNAMDAPLSYASPLITKSVSVHRGIASVTTGVGSLGGHIEVELDRGEFSNDSAVGADGKLASRYHDNGELLQTAARLSVANNAHRFSFIGQRDSGDDLETPVGTIEPTELERSRYDLSYAYFSESLDMQVNIGRLDTEDAGTPALAMDIRTIETDLVGFKFGVKPSDDLKIQMTANITDVEHWMDNFSLRTPPTNLMMYRQNFATGEGSSVRIGTEYSVDDTQLSVGIDLNQSDHDSFISNPNMAMFGIHNFNEIERDLSSIYSQLEKNLGVLHWELGLRYSIIDTNAGEVGATGLMGMMGDNATILADMFNTADRDLDFSGADVVAKLGLETSPNSKVLIEVGSKTRAPSHQELYLWLPLQATGGLADGRNYIGNLNLKKETSNEINMGFEWQGEKGMISPQFFFKKIEDYIQGTPTTIMPANMVATMMSGAPALQFNNVEAEILGFDLAWNYILNDAFLIEGGVSYAEGERTDTDDYLYRQSPNNARLALHYQMSDWHFVLENHVYARQDKVAEFNNELETAGYGLVNARVKWDALENLRFEFSAQNLTDKVYQDHLAGINRVMGVDIPQGDRIYGQERSFALGAIYTF